MSTRPLILLRVCSLCCVLCLVILSVLWAPLWAFWYVLFPLAEFLHARVWFIPLPPKKTVCFLWPFLLCTTCCVMCQSVL